MADARCKTDMKRKIGIAKTAIRKMALVLTSSRLRIQTRNRASKAYIWLTLYSTSARHSLRACRWRAGWRQLRYGTGGECWRLVGRKGEVM